MSKLNTKRNFCFAGILEKGQPFIYNYCEINADGFDIPLEETDSSNEKYIPIFKVFFEMYASQIETDANRDEIVKTIILAAPQKARLSVIKDILTKINNIHIIIEISGIILPFINNNDEKNHVFVHINNMIQQNLREKIINGETVIEILQTYDFLPRKPIIKLLADLVPKTDTIINTLLAIDEKAVIDVYKLKELYNKLLRSEKLQEISHNNNLYAIFADYDRQYKKLQALGLKDYYDYGVPDSWDDFMKEVKVFNDKFKQVGQFMESDIKKKANDFFERVQDDYYASSSVDYGENLKDKSLELNLENIKKGIYDAKSDDQLIAYSGLIRSKYEAHLRSEEKSKDPQANGTRKGRELINFAITKSQNDWYSHWCNLNIILHREEEKELWKRDMKHRIFILNLAFEFYTKELNNKSNHAKTKKGGKKK